MRLIFLMLMLFSLPVFADGTYNCNFTVQTDFTTSGTSTMVLPRQGGRRCLIFENKDASIKVYVKFSGPHSATEGIVLQPNARWEAVIPSGQSVYLKAASGTPVVGVMSGK